MMTIAKIFAIMIALVPLRAQAPRETEDAARARYHVIASAIAAEAGKDTRLAAYMLTVARHESSFRRDIHSGKKRGDGGRSWGLYQIMVGRSATRLLPHTAKTLRLRARDIVGVSPEATLCATRAAAYYLRPIIKRCSGAPMCVFGAYGGVSMTSAPSKTKERLRARVATYLSIRGQR